MECSKGESTGRSAYTTFEVRLRFEALSSRFPSIEHRKNWAFPLTRRIKCMVFCAKPSSSAPLDAHLLKGEVEADESSFGGKRKGKRGRKAKGKIPVFGILERQGKGEGGDGRRPERGESTESHDQEGQEREPYLHGQIPE
jgi:hypothetical protein